MINVAFIRYREKFVLNCWKLSESKTRNRNCLVLSSRMTAWSDQIVCSIRSSVISSLFFLDQLLWLGYYLHRFWILNALKRTTPLRNVHCKYYYSFFTARPKVVHNFFYYTFLLQFFYCELEILSALLSCFTVHNMLSQLQ